MKTDYKNAFGSAPESFHERMMQSLDAVQEEKKVKKMSLKMVLVMAIAGVLLVGAAYAAVTQWGLMDYFEQWDDVEVTEAAQALLTQEKPLQTGMLTEDIEVDITSAIADGYGVYVSAVFRPTSPEVVLLGGTDLYDAMNSPMDEGKRYYSVELDLMGHEAQIDSGSQLHGEDGSVMMVIMGALLAEGEEMDLNCYVIADAQEAHWMPGERTTAVLTTKIPISPVLETRVATQRVPMAGTGMSITEVELIRTALTTYGKATYAYDDGQAVADPWNILRLEFADAKGKTVPYGLSLGGSVSSEDDVHFTMERTLSLTSLPETIWLRAFQGEETLGNFEVSF